MKKMGVSSRLPLISNRLMKPLPKVSLRYNRRDPLYANVFLLAKKTSLQANISPPKNRISY